MNDPGEPFDVFISYSHSDGQWVWSWLVPRLKESALSVCTDQESFDVGVPSLVNMERAVAASRHTLLVLSLAWVRSEWTAYEALLTQQKDPTGLLQRTLPVLHEPCEPPDRIAMLTYADLTGRKDMEVELAKVVDGVKGVRRLPDAKEGKRVKNASEPAASALEPPAGGMNISIGTLVAENFAGRDMVVMPLSERASGSNLAARTGSPCLTVESREGLGLNAVIWNEAAHTVRVQVAYVLEVRRTCTLLDLDLRLQMQGIWETGTPQVTLNGRALTFRPDRRLGAGQTLVPGRYSVTHSKIWTHGIGVEVNEAQRLVLLVQTAEPGGIREINVPLALGPDGILLVTAEDTYAITSPDSGMALNHELLERLKRIEAKIDAGRDEDRLVAVGLLTAMQQNRLDQAEAARMMRELQSWAETVQQQGLPADPGLLAAIEALTDHSGSTYQYLQLAVPIIPGILSYNIELGSQHQADLQRIWERIRKKVRGEE